MGKSISVTTSIGQAFSSKKDCADYFRGMMQRYPYGVPLDSFDEHQVRGLLGNHRRREVKIGCGIEYFFILKSRNGYGCFAIRRTDGSTDIFRVEKCFEAERNHLRDFSNAFRHAHQADIVAFRRWKFKHHAVDGRVECPLTGQWLRPKDGHVDHHWPSHREIVDLFLALEIAENPRFLEILEYDRETGQEGPIFKCPELAEKVRRFHLSKCNLRFISASANLSRAHLARRK